MNMIPRNRSLSVVMSEAAMLLTLDKIIANAMLDGGSDPAVDVIKRTQSDKAFHEAFVRWGLKLRSAQLNEEDVGQSPPAESGLVPTAPSSSTNSNGDGHSQCAVDGGQRNTATPLLLNEDDEGQKTRAQKGHLQGALSSSLHKDRGPALRPGPRENSRFEVKHNAPSKSTSAVVQVAMDKAVRASSLMVINARGLAMPLGKVKLSEAVAYLEEAGAIGLVISEVWNRYKHDPSNMHKTLEELEPNLLRIEAAAIANARDKVMREYC